MNPASTTVFRENRERFSIEELEKHQGEWVAFSPDGRRIVASAPSIAEVVDRLRADKQDTQNVVFEHIEFDSDVIYLGGAELQ
jgi:hypothetical protein